MSPVLAMYGVVGAVAGIPAGLPGIGGGLVIVPINCASLPAFAVQIVFFRAAKIKRANREG